MGLNGLSFKKSRNKEREEEKEIKRTLKTKKKTGAVTVKSRRVLDDEDAESAEDIALLGHRCWLPEGSFRKPRRGRGTAEEAKYREWSQGCQVQTQEQKKVTKKGRNRHGGRCVFHPLFYHVFKAE